MGGIKIAFFFIVLLINGITFSQIKTGKIVFERRTNLEKRFKDEDSRWFEFLETNKFKIDVFELYFNDTCSIFKPLITDEIDQLSWTTTQNSVFQNSNTNMRLMKLNMWGQDIFVSDTMTTRQWKITENKRVIGRYECRKAIWQKNDSTRIYAWYSPEIIPTVGPEGFSGLPGAILGLATEDGGIIYFAKSVEILEPTKENFVIETKRKKLYSYTELKVKLEEDYGKEKWGKDLFENLFRWL
jgi:GLPGLI family protein